MRLLAADRTLWVADVPFHWVFGPYFHRQGHFLAWFWWSKFSVAASKSRESSWKMWTWNFFAQRFLADTLQPMLNIQNLRLILPQAPEEENYTHTCIFHTICVYFFHTICIFLFFCMFDGLPSPFPHATKETLQNQKLQSWFLPINGQWIIDDRVPRSHVEVVLGTNHVTLAETYWNNSKLMLVANETWKALCKSCQWSCRFPNPSARIFMPWFAGRLQEGSGAYFGMNHHLGNLTGFPTVFQKKNTSYNFCNQFWLTFFENTDLANHKLREIHEIISSQLGEVWWGAIPSNHLGRFCPGCWLRITCRLEFSRLRLGRKRHLVGFLWRSICTLTLNTKPLNCNQIPLDVFFKG